LVVVQFEFRTTTASLAQFENRFVSGHRFSDASKGHTSDGFSRWRLFAVTPRTPRREFSALSADSALNGFDPPKKSSRTSRPGPMS
jgi:hypothetical protein